jgi:hypothetical protein
MDAVPYGCAPVVGVEVAIGLFALERRQKGGWPPALRRTPADASLLRFPLPRWRPRLTGELFMHERLLSTGVACLDGVRDMSAIPRSCGRSAR